MLMQIRKFCQYRTDKQVFSCKSCPFLKIEWKDITALSIFIKKHSRMSPAWFSNWFKIQGQSFMNIIQKCPFIRFPEWKNIDSCSRTFYIHIQENFIHIQQFFIHIQQKNIYVQRLFYVYSCSFKKTSFKFKRFIQTFKDSQRLSKSFTSNCPVRVIVSEHRDLYTQKITIDTLIF